MIDYEYINTYNEGNKEETENENPENPFDELLVQESKFYEDPI